VGDIPSSSFTSGSPGRKCEREIEFLVSLGRSASALEGPESLCRNAGPNLDDPASPPRDGMDGMRKSLSDSLLHCVFVCVFDSLILDRGEMINAVFIEYVLLRKEY
jgi:hypothetical protein